MAIEEEGNQGIVQSLWKNELDGQITFGSEILAMAESNIELEWRESEEIG